MSDRVPGRGFDGPPAILILDDEIDHAAIVRVVLQQIAPGLPVETMTEAAALRQRLKSAPQGTLVLMDRMLGGREAIELLPELRASRPDVTVALLSAALSATDQARAIAAGADCAYEKPGRIDEWRALLMHLLWSRDGTWSAVA